MTNSQIILKLMAFIITGFICSNKEVKQVFWFIIAGFSCYKGDGAWNSAYSPKNGGGTFSPQKLRGW